MNLYQKLAAISKEIGHMDKTGKNERFNYNFIEHKDVIAAIRGQLANHNIVIVPEIVAHEMTVKEKGAKVVASMQFTIIDGDKPEDRITAHWYGEGDDTLDKATNKAATSGEKYWLMKLFKISDGLDPDGDTAEETHTKQVAQPASKNGNGQLSPEPKPPEDDPFAGLDVTPATSKATATPVNANPATPAQIRAIYGIGKTEQKLSDEEVDETSVALYDVVPANLTKFQASQLIDKLKSH